MTATEIVLVIAAALGSGGLVSWLQVRTTRDKEVSETEKNRADTQGVIIKALQDENTRLSGEVRTLRIEVAELRGHLEALERIKVEQIASATAKKVLEELTGEEFDPI